jgi:FixJ family two-component response regulator
MPHMNGLDVFFQLRELHVDVPVILVAGHPDPGIRRRARAAGVELIEKPLSQDILLAAISKAQLAKAADQGEAT